ncbi:hypothetical protein OKJ48_00060 [Streptomyces kunmingensis]|uniref:Uncharacterized protein n=1 Tax=Streptomyces kunmingensis TaxID=68225 RepID=A0ABU6C282_9ACTN|nr:hypothetical protein [Streptomyces kunmingensis]MEB3958663.1 hypothetical protein [Streptomyces kunmingensis]
MASAQDWVQLRARTAAARATAQALRQKSEQQITESQAWATRGRTPQPPQPVPGETIRAG